MRRKTLDKQLTEDKTVCSASCALSLFYSVLKNKLSLIQLKRKIMNWLDAVIVVILILSLVMGFINGLVKEVASLAALIL